MTLARTLATAALAFTTACATAPKTRPQASPVPALRAGLETPVPKPAAALPSSSQERFDEALAAYQAGQLDRAEEGFEEVLEQRPQSVNAQFNLGVIAERRGKLDDAKKAYHAARKIDPHHLPTLLNLGRLHRAEERFDAAISLYEEALKAPGHEHEAALLNNLTVAYRLAGKYAEAEATAKRVLARTQDNAEAYKNLSLIYYDQKQYRLAELVSANARKLDEKDPGIYNNLGMIYLKMNERPRALAQFQKAVQLDERFAPGHLNLGAMALAYRDYAGAERSFAKAVELDPRSYEGYLYFAYALDGQKGRDPKKGIAAGQAFEKVLALRKDHPPALCGAGWAYAADKEGWDKATDFLERCKNLSSTTPAEQQQIDAKLKGLVAMKQSGQLQPAAAPEKKPAPAAAAASPDGKLLDRVSDEAARAEGTDARPAEATGGAAAEGTAAPEEPASRE